MLKFIYLSAVAALLIFCGCEKSPNAENEPADYLAFLEEIRTNGMTGLARQSLSTVAGFICGQSSYQFQKDEASGIYWVGMHSNTCSLPGSTPEELAEWRKKIKEERNAVVESLRRVADADSSGFVSTEEGQKFREIYEFGMKAAFVISEEGRDLSVVSQGCRVEPDNFLARVSEYNQCAEAIARVGVQGAELLKWTEE